MGAATAKSFPKIIETIGLAKIIANIAAGVRTREMDILLFIRRRDLFKDIVESNHDPNFLLYGYMS